MTIKVKFTITARKGDSLTVHVKITQGRRTLVDETRDDVEVGDTVHADLEEE